MNVYACIMVVVTVLPLPSAGTALLFEWGLSRWKKSDSVENGVLPF